MVKKRSKRREEASGSGMAVDSTDGDGGWQVGVSAADGGPADDGQEPAGMDTTDITLRQGKAPTLKAQGTSMKVRQGGKQGTRGQRTKAQKKRKALKLAKALSHADRKGVSVGKKAAATAVKKDLKKLWTTDKKPAPVAAEQ